MRKTTKQEIVLATRNKNKVVEIRAMIGDLVKIQTIADFVKIGIPEFGRSLLENSFAKAAFAFRLCGKPTLADDSGLFVSSLDGEPGIYSSRYGRNDEERITRLLKNMTGAKNRKAAFRVVFVYYYAPGKYEIFEGECVGRIAGAPRGSEGFGYDPVFIPRGHRTTFAELGPATKNRISHRSNALRKFREYLTRKTS
ncbi:RdgB/HAM1 family non-canonical purine NTP pyrophosphatase [candidate division WOR-3 bacterium]|nr:RdgB/HAM1 family non-canonical purine NTP pyrophosphatase [candidate division WOR-3 bacterium]